MDCNAQKMEGIVCLNIYISINCSKFQNLKPNTLKED